MNWIWLKSIAKVFTGSENSGQLIEEISSKIPDANSRLKLNLTLQELISGMQKKILDLESQLLKSKTDLIKTEMQGNWFQKSWRPVLMLMFGFIVIYNYWFAPTFGTPTTELPQDFWQLLKISIGGYVIGRSGEKIVPQLSDKLRKN